MFLGSFLQIKSSARKTFLNFLALQTDIQTDIIER